MDELSIIKKDFENYFNDSNIDIQNLSEKLSSYMKNKLYYNPSFIRASEGIKIFEDFETKNLRQSYFKNCIFKGANYTQAGLAGSIFIKSDFYPCNFYDSNLQSCDFRECNFNDVEFNFTRLNKSMFYNSIFNNCTFKSVLLNDVIFEKCNFSNCKWIPVLIENTLFRNTTIKNTIFRNMNFEFSIFENIYSENIKLPFPTIPFIYNGINYLLNTDDNVRITSAKHSSGISKDEYLKILPDLEEFYKYTKNFFPLANILIAKELFDKAFSCIVYGVELTISTRSFRMLKYYCKLIKYIKGVNQNEKQSLYRHIINKISLLELHSFEKDSLEMYLPEVKKILLAVPAIPRIEIVMQTNIIGSEYDKVAILYSVIDKTIDKYCFYSIELRHSSPLEVFIEIFSKKENIALIVSVISLLFVTIQTKISYDSFKMQKEKILNETQSENINECKKLLSQNNININNLTINNQGNIYTETNNYLINEKHISE